MQWVDYPLDLDWTWEPQKHIGDVGVAMLPELARRLGDKWPCKKAGRPREESKRKSPPQSTSVSKRRKSAAASSSKPARSPKRQKTEEAAAVRMGVDDCVQAVLALPAEDITSVQAKLWAALINK